MVDKERIDKEAESFPHYHDHWTQAKEFALHIATLVRKEEAEPLQHSRAKCRCTMAQPEQEPVAYQVWYGDNNFIIATSINSAKELSDKHGNGNITPLYANPQPERKFLDDGDAIAISRQFGGMSDSEWEIVEAFEKAYGITE